MAKLRIMYWKEIPIQVQAEDESDTISKQLDGRFQEAVSYTDLTLPTILVV